MYKSASVSKVSGRDTGMVQYECPLRRGLHRTMGVCTHRALSSQP